MRVFTILLIIPILIITACSPAPDGEQVVDNSIRYHDPGGLWGSSAIHLQIAEHRPEAAKRATAVRLNANGIPFALEQIRHGHLIKKIVPAHR